MLARVRKADDPDGCWLWQGALKENGYGVIGDDASRKGQVYVHRLMWRETYGHMPVAGLEVCHTCDVRNCVRPDHLFVGTHAENVRDQVEKGRNRKGIAMYWAAKVDDAAVRVIRQRVTAGERRVDLAREYGLSVSSIDNIVNRKRWAHVA
jgi:hypothetical protein